jgi:hypothetical protein
MSTLSRVTAQIKQDAKDGFKDFLLTTVLGDQYPQENILHKYRTFNYNVTLAIVSPEEFKTAAYRNFGLDYPIFQSHGKPIAGAPIIRGGSKKLEELQQLLGNLNGLRDDKWDFYLQDLYIKNSFTAKRDIGTEFRLKIVEPYGMDTFIKSVLEGLRVKGYDSFGKGNAFVLKLEFVGFRDDKETPEIIPFATRYYPIIISTITAEVTEQGTVYEITGAPLNDTGRYTDVNVIPQDFTVSGNTVKEVLTGERGLLNFLNKTPKKEKEDAGYVANEYSIVFLNEEGKPTENGGEIISKILSSKMYDHDTDSGQRAFSTNYTQYITVANLTQRTSEKNELEFAVPGKIGIAKIIDNLIIESDYVKDMLLNNFQGAFDPKTGMVPWWRITTKVEITKFDKSKNIASLKVIYMVTPRRVPWQKLASIFFPNTKAEPEDYERFCTRRYEWNYTGNNRDVLNFRIHYDHLYVRFLSANLGKLAAAPGESSANQGSDTEQEQFKTNADTLGQFSGEINASLNNPGNVTAEDPKLSSSALVSKQDTGPKANLARDVNALLNNPLENVNIEMEILGDPMWLGTQFIDNLSLVDSTKSDLYTTDGGIAMRTIDPCIRVIAYAPSDINNEGFLATDNDQDKKVSEWSAYYMIYEIESFFTGGIFKQKLKGYRLTDTDMKKAAKISSPIDIFGFKKMGAVI